MARIPLMLGRNRDMPFLVSAYQPAVAAGSAADFEYAQVTVPDLTKLTPASSGSAGDLAINAVALRAAYMLPIATITGNATNNCLFNIQQRRNLGVNIPYSTTIASGASVVTPVTGSGMNNIQIGTRLDIGAVGTPETVAVTAVTATTFTATFANTHTFAATPITIVNSVGSPFMAYPVNTTSATTIVASTMAVTPLSMSNIGVGTQLYLSAGTGAAEVVVVQSVTATTFTATFANGHSGAYTIISAPLATLNFNVATTISQINAPTLLNPYLGNQCLAGDVLTFQRVSNNATGLAGAAAGVMYINYEFVPAKVSR